MVWDAIRGSGVAPQSDLAAERAPILLGIAALRTASTQIRGFSGTQSSELAPVPLLTGIRAFQWRADPWLEAVL